MAITHAFSFMVHPKTGNPSPSSIRGSSVPLNGKLFDLLKDVYDKSDKECDIDIIFKPSDTGVQKNECRDVIRSFAKNPCIKNRQSIAGRLQSVTDGRSGPGLLFLILGKENGQHKLLISRFPADSGILAEEDSSGLKLDYIEKVFLKSANSYKAAMYKHASLDSGFWNAKAIDRQNNNSAIPASDYWVRKFLDSDFETTSAAGTNRLANALKSAINNSKEDSVTSELIAVGQLLSNTTNIPISINSIKDKYGISDKAFSAIKIALNNDSLLNDTFNFDRSEFFKVVKFRMVKLKNGAIITAPFNHFDEIVKQEEKGDSTTRFIIEGEVDGETIQKGMMNA